VTALPAGDVQKVLGDLLGVAVRVRAGETPTGGAGVAGLYVDGTGRHSAAVWLERSLAACAGASLAAVPVEDVEAADVLPDRVVEQVGQLLTALATILNPGRRVKLDAVVQTPPAPPELGDLLGGAVDPTWFTVEVGGGCGGVALVVQARTELARAA
jgi:hypothetical protein